MEILTCSELGCTGKFHIPECECSSIHELRTFWQLVNYTWSFDEQYEMYIELDNGR